MASRFRFCRVNGMIRDVHASQYYSAVAIPVQDELRTVRRLLKQCEEEREAEASRRQQTDERLLQVLEDNRSLASQLEQRQQSAAVQHEVYSLGDSECLSCHYSPNKLYTAQTVQCSSIAVTLRIGLSFNNALLRSLL